MGARLRRRPFDFLDSVSRSWGAGRYTPVTWLGVIPLFCLVALIACDLLLLTADILYRARVLHDPRFAVDQERGFGEMFQYLKFAAIAIAFGRRSRRTGSVAAGLLAAVFVYLLVDDAFSVHELAGAAIGTHFQLAPVGALGPAHVGEVLYILTLGTVIAAALGVLLWRGSDADWRMVAGIGTGLAMLAVPGVGVDVLDAAIRQPWLRPALAILEDGGEMIAASALLAVAVIFVPSDRHEQARRAEFAESSATRSIRPV